MLDGYKSGMLTVSVMQKHGIEALLLLLLLLLLTIKYLIHLGDQMVNGKKSVC